MADRFNTAAGWALFSGVVALGLASLSGHVFRADKENRPEKMGYEIAGVAKAGGGVAEAPFEALLATTDAAKGEETFKKCASCHTIAQGGANGIGPNLYAVLGDAIGLGRGGYAFSDGLKKHAGKWDWKAMNDWLKSPRAFADGTKMTFAGLDDGQERANLMAYLNKQGSNLPLPAVPAAAAGAAAAGGAVAAVAKPGDAAHGAEVFKKCSACHVLAGANGIGPSLGKIVGDDVGKGRGGYAFSDALAKKGGKWDAATLDKWLANPREFAAGTKMTFAGLENAQDRADVIAYLKAN